MGPRRLSPLLVCSAVALVCGATGCSPADPASNGPPDEGDDKLPLASVERFVQRVHGEAPAHSRRFAFPIGSDAVVETLVDSYDESRGRMSMIGRAADSADSEFILKVNEAGVYGWMVDRESDVAWEVTTDGEGNVSTAEVPVERIFPVCPVPHDHAEPLPAEEPVVAFAMTSGFPAHVGTYPGNDVTKLQSRPESEKVWYIDMTDTMNGSEPKSGHTKEDVWVTWAIAAATLYSFDVNVTTDPDVYAATDVSNSGCTNMIYAGIGDGSSCGLNLFGTRRCCDNHLYNNGYATGRILNHEAGHGLGLGHDGGDNGGEYFEGFSQYQWTPLMGNVWPADRWQQALIQFSKGEYTSATQRQDDFAIIERSLEYVPDDIPDTKPLALDGTTVAAEQNWGQIARNTDTDSWTFEIGPGSGHATLAVNRIEHRGGSMLDVDAAIVDSMGATVQQDNADVARGAELDVDLPAGRYTLVVEGGAEGTPQNGFSNYSSVGLYAISGTLAGGISAGGTGGMGGIGGMAGAPSGGMAGAGMGGVGGLAGTAGDDNGGSGAGLGGSAGLAGMAGAITSGAGGQTASGGAGASGVGGGSGGVASAGASGSSSGAAPTAGNGGSTSTAGAVGIPGTGGSGAPTPSGTSVTDTSSGCGCRVTGAETTRSWWLVALAGVAAAFVRRRRGMRDLRHSVSLARSA